MRAEVYVFSLQVFPIRKEIYFFFANDYKTFSFVNNISANKVSIRYALFMYISKLKMDCKKLTLANSKI